jgi:short subunit dehydrogenase-like uncharacterized protein
VQQIIDSQPPGLTDAKREKAMSLVWGEVRNSAGKTAAARLSAPDAYTLTAYSTLLITKKILGGVFEPAIKRRQVLRRRPGNGDRGCKKGDSTFCVIVPG